MKKVLFIAALFTFLTTDAQVNNPPNIGATPDPALVYLKKSKNLKTAGWCLLGAGTIIGAIGVSQLDAWDVLTGGGNSEYY